MGTYLRSSLQAILIGSVISIALTYLGFVPTVLNLPLLSSLLNSPPSPAIAIDESSNITYRGISTNGIDHFFNIFYAHDTSGPNRFLPPQPLTPLSPGTIIDATTPGAVCPQAEGPAAFPFTSPVTNTSENCLSLRVSRPAGLLPADGKLPVVVYIHGGGNILGTGTDQLYEPDGLIRQGKRNGQPVVFVAMNYRLGIFGYAMSKALREEGSTNVGLRDQRAALEWVRENIAVFGGDSTRVTAVGQSVGASSLGLHLTSYKGERGVPFDQAVMMSGASGLNFNIMSDVVADNTATVARAVGCTGDFHSAATVECLREVPLGTLMNESVALARKLHPPFGELSFYPSYDGDYIQDRPSELLKRGQFVQDVPLIASWVTNDGAWYPPPSVDSDESVIASIMAFVPNLTPASQQRILSAYPPSDFAHLVTGDGPGQQYYRAAQINRDLWFTCPVIDFTWQYARRQQQQQQQQQGSTTSNVRLYAMNATRYGPVYAAIGVPFWRVAHLSDIPYVLNGHVAGGGDNSPAQRALAEKVSGSIAAFAHTGDPTTTQRGGQDVLGDWPAAYDGAAGDELGDVFPHRVNVRVIGGVHDGGAARLRKHKREDGRSERELALGWERLFERCEVFNSLSEEIGV